jgi:hypothetical protein
VALAALPAAVAAGGTLYATRFQLQKRHEFERSERERRERSEMMRAARVLDSELLAMEAMLKHFVVSKHQLWPDTIEEPEGLVWPELRAVVATAVNPAGWITLNNGFRAMADARAFAEEHRKSYDFPAALPPSQEALYESPLKDITKARAALHPVAYPDHVRVQRDALS